MGQELQIPESFKNRQMAGAFAGLNAQDDNLAEGIGQSYAVIGYKGKTWSLRHRGERKNILNPVDGTPSSYLDVIVLGQAKAKSKSFYKKYDPGTSDGDRPICSSIDGIVPDADVTAKQCESCALCPKNVWKTDPQTGRKGRECTDYKRLAVLILPTQTKPILGAPLMEPAFLRVPPDSLNSLAIMGETMAQQGYHYSSYITRITFDPNKAHPCMVFRPLQGLTDQEGPVIMDMRADAAVGRITGGDAGTVGLRAVEHVLATPGANATGLTAPAAGAASVASPGAPSLLQASDKTTASSSATAGVVQPATKSTTAVQQSTSQNAGSGLLDTGFGGAASATQQGAAQNQTAADAGSPEESDDELDARIASLITRG